MSEIAVLKEILFNPSYRTDRDRFGRNSGEGDTVGNLHFFDRLVSDFVQNVHAIDNFAEDAIAVAFGGCGVFVVEEVVVGEVEEKLGR